MSGVKRIRGEDASFSVLYVPASDYDRLAHRFDLLDDRERASTNAYELGVGMLESVSAERDALQVQADGLAKVVERSAMRIKELDLLFGRYILGMRSAVIEMEHGKGAEAAMAWIVNGLTGPGELPPEDETDAQAYFDREIKAVDAGMEEVFAYFNGERVRGKAV